jgi:DNA-binding CsgD family transcriptional regulator
MHQARRKTGTAFVAALPGSAVEARLERAEGEGGGRRAPPLPGETPLWPAGLEQPARRDAPPRPDLTAEPLEPSWGEIALAAWLDREGAGHLLLRRDSRVLWASQAASRLLQSGGPLVLRSGRLAVSDPLRQSELDTALSGVGRPGSERLIGDAAGRPAIHLRARPTTGGHIAIRLTDIRQPALDLPNLRALYGLTESESAVLEALLNGHPPQAIAGQFGNTLQTVRTHLKRAYAKIGVSTKEQLFALVLRLMR